MLFWAKHFKILYHKLFDKQKHCQQNFVCVIKHHSITVLNYLQEKKRSNIQKNKSEP